MAKDFAINICLFADNFVLLELLYYVFHCVVVEMCNCGGPGLFLFHFSFSFYNVD